MYLRTTQRHNQDGSVVCYVGLAHNRRVDGVTQAQVLLNLGREDALDRDGLARLVASINRYLGEPGSRVPADAAELVGDGLQMTGSRPLGTVHLLDGLWHALGVDTALRKVLGARRFTTDIERVLFALVANRAIDPMSKLSAAEWASCDVAIPGLEAMDEDQAYRRWTCWWRPTRKRRCRRRCSSPWPICSTSRSTCCSSTPPPPTSNATPKRPVTTPSASTGTPRTTDPTCHRS
jgi:hypothetical protein